MTAPADPNKEALYAWEDEWRSFGDHLAPHKELRSLIRRALKWAGVKKPVKVRFRPKAMSGRPSRIDTDYDADTRTITLGWLGQNRPTALHEVAHVIVVDKYWDGAPDHGRAFCKEYAALLEWDETAPKGVIEASMKARGLL